ncbi:fused response regulator/thioredoxin-disulfide reductase [Hymenobacter amundsenii]|uniref:Fused response regulator/thioredoxin-disulfide reductase n=1 Tax=Hymenobacter amundsenii TaxID=2006685 RepID=A0A246FG70_9BACT|nr:FAD-dependent oxidoreductase [Hymenobacter amundsenii]OWP61504.1 fused response regulator/thioredoxin-disulfide reductase [Hymenobacter amundsenii]
MTKPIILCIDDDPQVLRAIARDLKEQYRATYQVLSAASGAEALELLAELRKAGRAVALLLSDHRMPDLNGVQFLDQARQFFPEAQRVLLTGYADTEAAIKAINEVQLHYYLLKPWDPPEEKLYPVLDDLLEAWQFTHTAELVGLKLIGHPFSPKAHELKDFLSGNLVPYRWMEYQTSDAAQELVALNNIDPLQLPALFFEDGSYLLSPSIGAVAAKIGLHPTAVADLYDVVIIGAGPAGLAAAVYGASEGLKTLLIDKRAPGGQAGTSSRIENYLGFPAGLSGSELARRATVQATRLGAEFLMPQEVGRIALQDGYKILHLLDGTHVTTKSVVVTTGVDYRQLDVPGVHDFTGAGVYYGAATTEASACRGQDVYITGGGNSAGQAAMYLSQVARSVVILIRGQSLAATMSAYLIEQIRTTPNISVRGFTEVVAGAGTDRLTHLTLRDNRTGQEQTVPAHTLFVFIGAKPFTDWLPAEVLKNPQGFVLTGRDVQLQSDFRQRWRLSREPHLLETSVPGIFAAGDVRAGAMARVASATGEGATTISYVHRYLAEV